MEVVVLLEYEAGASATRAALLERIGALALAGRGRLSFVAVERDEAGRPAREIVAVGFAKAVAVDETLARWRADGALPATASARRLGVEPVWSIEPLALMFP